DQRVIGPETYEQLMTMHGVTMIFFFIITMTTGAFGNYLVPLMIGARDMAFPRLNALSYWIFLGAGIFMYSSFLVHQAPNAGWFDYVPLALRRYDGGLNVDFYALGLIFYIIVLPAFGIATSIIPTFARHRMVAFPLVAMAELLVAFIGFGVWAHHMFATGIASTTLAFFGAASMMVVVPSTIQIYAWLMTV